MKKGFTLVELVATIVVIALLAVIALPKVTDEIETAREKTAITSLQNYIRALDEQLIEKKLDSGIYDINELEVKVSGKKPSSGTVKITSDEVEEATVVYGTVTVKYEKGKDIEVVE